LLFNKTAVFVALRIWFGPRREAGV
jgi:hypothetical protein